MGENNRINQVIDKIFEEAKKYNWGFILIRKSEFHWFINHLLEKFGKIRVLEVGAWRCFMRAYLHDNFGRDKVEYVGIDVVDPEVGGLSRDKDAIFYVMNPESMLFPSETFHAVIIIETLEHSINYVQVLREAYRVLMHGGGIFIQSQTCNVQDETHYHVLHAVTLSRLLRHIGFRDVGHVDLPNFAVWGFK